MGNKLGCCLEAKENEVEDIDQQQRARDKKLVGHMDANKTQSEGDNIGQSGINMKDQANNTGNLNSVHGQMKISVDTYGNLNLVSHGTI